jgi:hypothetical protein
MDESAVAGIGPRHVLSRVGSGVVQRNGRRAGDDPRARQAMEGGKLLVIVVAIEKDEIERPAVEILRRHLPRRFGNEAMIRCEMGDRFGIDGVDHAVGDAADRGEEVPRRVSGLAAELGDPSDARHATDREEQKRFIVLDRTADLLARRLREMGEVVLHGRLGSGASLGLPRSSLGCANSGTSREVDPILPRQSAIGCVRGGMPKTQKDRVNDVVGSQKHQGVRA